ncbi:uncharacterized protein PHALS_08014 [Plasmopara halstedii]|uniref:Uncharacterized protein n=1 Tax=Plasmopara halstedii TaxID=4781 RepID=A0A0P1B8G9_PLAHL|nr:uncharacterized protein PHALS_08014 [Plasmopara halstedii]CEG50293.1 hypothetical protein PHALS_08014 [Plasmopara halstedii]|eukprot:XP_024586662.1 hypothetical protein PHALS_08014 [Plasmopara halstedii]
MAEMKILSKCQEHLLKQMFLGTSTDLDKSCVVGTTLAFKILLEPDTDDILTYSLVNEATRSDTIGNCIYT